MNGHQLHRRTFLGAVAKAAFVAASAPVWLAAAIRAVHAAAGGVALISSGPTARDFSAWAGRGCSATASVLAEMDASPTEPYEIDFEQETAAVFAAVLPSSLFVDDAGVLKAESGSMWAFVKLPLRADKLAGAPKLRLDGLDAALVVDG